eukprot:380624-Amphidinium_carterae.1
MSVDEDLSRSRSRQFHGNDRQGFGSGFPIPTTTYAIYTPRDDASMPQACMVNPNYQSVSHPPGFPPTIPPQMLQQQMNMDVESGIFIESGPQMWYPPSTRQHGYVQGRQQTTYFPSQVQGQSPMFSMAPPEPRPSSQSVGFQIPHTSCDPRVSPRPMGTQGTPDPFDFHGSGGHQGTVNQVVSTHNRVNQQHGHPQPREASSIDLPELPTPP